MKSGRGSQKSRVGDGWKRRPLQRGATEPDSRSSPGRPVGVHLPQSEPRQDNVKKREGNPGAAVVGPRQDAAQGRCETLGRVPAGIIWDGRDSVPGFGGRLIGSSCSGWLVNTETLAGVHGHRLEERHTEMDPEAGPTEAFSSKKTFRELADNTKVQCDTIAGVLNVMGEEGRLIRFRRGKQKVLRSRARGGDGSGSDGTAVERHGGPGRSTMDRQFPPPGVKAVPSYGCPPFRRGVAHAGGARVWQPQNCTIRGRTPRRCGRGYSWKSASDVGWHGFPESSAVKRRRAPPPCVPASPGASARRTGGGVSGGSDPLFFAAGAAPGRGRWCTPKSTTTPPLSGVAPSTVIPGGKAIERCRGQGRSTDRS